MKIHKPKNSTDFGGKFIKVETRKYFSILVVYVFPVIKFADQPVHLIWVNSKMLTVSSFMRTSQNPKRALYRIYKNAFSNFMLKRGERHEAV